MTVWFDLEDLFHYVQSGHRRPSGIQRLTLEIYAALHALDPDGERARFVRHADGARGFNLVGWDQIERSFLAAGEDTPAASIDHRRLGRKLLRPVPEEVRAPLVAAGAMQVQAAGELLRFAARLVRPRRRRRPDAPGAAAFEELAQPGDTLLVLGSPWFRQDYGAVARWLRDEKRMRFGLLMHDLVPIRRPEWSHRGVAATFESWYVDVLPFCDLVLANSRHTAADLDAYAREKGIALPRPARPLPVGAGLGRAAASPRPPHLPEPGSYVLFVSTLEARKNHALLFRIWATLLAEVRAGRRAAASVPDLVFAGRIGWLVADLVQQLDNTDWLGGRIRLVAGPTDAELQALYEGCRFTIFPSFHEGWGLPVTESLAAGKPCLCSNAAALPEAGEDLCRYFDPDDAAEAYRAVCAVLDDPAGLRAWEAEVRRSFRPIPWSATAAAVLDAVAQLDR